MTRCGVCLFIGCLFLLALQSSASARTWYIKANGTGDAPTIQAGCDSAQNGDTVLVGPGTYTPATQGMSQYGMVAVLRGYADMTIVGEAGAASTILNAQSQTRVFFFQGGPELTIDGLTFTQGQWPAGGDPYGSGFIGHFSSPILKNCVFSNNTAEQGGAVWFGGVGRPQFINCHFVDNTAASGGAMYLINSFTDVLISGCTFTNNTASGRGGAIYTYNFYTVMENCLFEQNTAGGPGGAISFNNSPYMNSILSSTFVGNSASAGAALEVFGNNTVMVDQTIMAFGLGGGAATVDGTSTLTFACSDLYGNAGGDWTGAFAAQLGTNGNISVDPFFCSLGAGDYTLHGGSPCTPGHHPDGADCGLIGRFDMGCGTVSNQDKTWGAIKSMYAQ